MTTQYRRTSLASADQSWIDVPAFAAGLMAALTGLIALTVLLGLNSFTGLLILLLLMGGGVSWLTGSGALPAGFRNMLVGIILAVSAIGAAMNPTVSAMIMRSTAIPSGDPNVAGFIAWVVVVYSFNLTSSRSVLFMCVPVLSLLGLVASLSAGEGIMPYFVIFLGLACFMMMRQNILSEYQAGSLASPGIMRLHVRWTALITSIAVITGLLCGALTFVSMDKLFMARWVSMYRTSFSSQRFAPRNYAPISSGPVGLDEQEVMTVKAEEGLHWRGQFFDKYTGHGWISTQSEYDGRLIRGDRSRQSGFLYGLAGYSTHFEIPEDPVTGPRKSVRRVRQDYRITSMGYHIVYGAAEPRMVEFDRAMPYITVGTEISTRRGFGPESTYTVESEVSSASPGELTAAAAKYPEGIRSRYLGVPESAWQVKALVEKLTAGQPTPYDKVMALTNYLQRNFRYETKVAPAPPDRDAVTHFLFKSKEGYCDIFSSALVVMARQAGIPSRWATGFAPGEYSIKDGLYHVQLKHQHAWAEVFFPGYGWITVDPTPSGDETESRFSAAAAVLRKMLIRARANWQAVFTGIIVLAMLAWVVKIEILERLRQRRFRSARSGPACENYARMSRTLSRFGLRRPDHMTPGEHASLLGLWFDPRFAPIAETVRGITRDFEESRYGGHDVPDDRLGQARDALRGLHSDLRSARRRRLLPNSAGRQLFA